MREDNYHLSIRDIPENDRPRERLELLGASSLTKAELIAILLRVGVEGINAVQLAQQLLDRFGGLRGLHAARFDDLCAVKGVGRAKAAQIKAAIELGHRMDSERFEKKPAINKPADVFDLIGHDLIMKEQEELWIMLLNTRNQLLRRELIYIGTVNHSSVRLAEVFEPSIRLHASSIIIVHNHPSGDPHPSDEDIGFTEELIKAGRLLDIGVLDHIIIARAGFYSIRQEDRVEFNTIKPRFWN